MTHRVQYLVGGAIGVGIGLGVWLAVHYGAELVGFLLAGWLIRKTHRRGSST